MKNYILTFTVILIFAVSCREDIPVAPENEERSSIYINSSPTGAKILLGLSETGRFTPDSLKNLRSGNYSVSLEKAGYRDTTFTVSVPEGFDPRIFIRLRDF